MLIGNDTLRIEIFRYKNIIYGTIIEQVDSLRGMRTYIGESVPFKLSSSARPELASERLLIRGNMRSRDTDIVFKEYSTIDLAKENFENICGIIKEFLEDDRGEVCEIHKE